MPCTVVQPSLVSTLGTMKLCLSPWLMSTVRLILEVDIRLSRYHPMQCQFRTIITIHCIVVNSLHYCAGHSPASQTLAVLGRQFVMAKSPPPVGQMDTIKSINAVLSAKNLLPQSYPSKIN